MKNSVHIAKVFILMHILSCNQHFCKKVRLTEWLIGTFGCKFGVEVGSLMVDSKVGRESKRRGVSRDLKVIEEELS